jgi:phage-related protein
MTALIPLLPILAGLALGLAAVWVMNELGVFDWIIQAGADFSEFISGAGPAFIEWISGLPGAISDALGGIGEWFDDLLDSINMTIWTIPETISEAFSDVVNTISTTLAGIPGALVSAFSSIAEAFTALGGRVQEAFTALFTGISEFIVDRSGVHFRGYNIIAAYCPGMQSACRGNRHTIGNIFNIIGQFIPHSRQDRPLSSLPNFGDILLITPATVPASKRLRSRG